MTTHRNPHPREVLDALLPKGPQTRIAVVGASNDPGKYGNVIVRNLARKGYTVLPVNLHETTIADLPAWPSLRQVPGPIHVVSIVTPPHVTLRILEEVAELGLPHVFLQDGSFDEDVLRYVDAAQFKTVYDACIMVVTNS